MDDAMLNKYLQKRRFLEKTFTIMFVLFVVFTALYFTFEYKIFKVIMLTLPFGLFSIQHSLRYIPVPKR